MWAVVFGLVGSFLLCELAGRTAQQTIYDSFAGRGLGVQSWQLLTSIFLHPSGVQLFFNLLALATLGRAVELIAGSEFFLFAFLFSALSGNLNALHWNPTGVVTGASGAICGMLGCLLVLLWWAQERTPQLEAPARSWQTFGLIFVAVLSCQPQLAWQGHPEVTAQLWGGFGGGLLACLVLRHRAHRIVVLRPLALALLAALCITALLL